LGCGAGKLRHHLNNIKPVTYYGLDPMVVQDIENFPFVRALAEYMPFKDNTFSDMVITAALDHFKDLDEFFAEAVRVLEPNGKLHIMQHVHELSGPITAVKTLAHWVKDTLEDSGTKQHKHDDVPHHMSEFTKTALFESSSKYFDVLAINDYSKKWYSPTIAFVSLGAKNIS
jgi:SAM-dependent methyltransferase